MSKPVTEKSPLLRSESTVTAISETDIVATDPKDGGGTQQVPGCCYSGRRWHPRCVELAVFFYFMAFNGTIPLMDQFVRAVIQDQKQYKLDRFMQYIAAMFDSLDTIDYPKSSAGHKCPDQGNQSTPFDKQLEDSVQSSASIWLMYIDLCNTVPAVIATLFICTLGDSMGRKFGIVVTSCGSTLKMALYLVAIYLETSPYVILLGSLVEGMTGSHLCFLGSTFGYVADVTTKKNRSIRMFILISANTLSSAFTNLGVGYLIATAGYTIVFWIFGIIHLLTTIYIVTCIPNVRPPPDQPGVVTGNMQRHNRSSIKKIKEDVKLVTQKLYGAVKVFSVKTEIKGQRLKLGLLMSAFIVQACVMMGKGASDVLFLLSYPRCFTSITYGFYSFFNNISHGLVCLVAVWVLTRCMRDITIELMGSLSFLAGRLVFAFATSQLHIYISMMLGCGSNICLTLLRAMMSKLVAPDKQGALFAVVFSVETLCDVLSGVLLNAVYAATLPVFPGFVSLVIAAMWSVNLVILIIYLVVERHTDKYLVVASVAVSDKQLLE